MGRRAQYLTLAERQAAERAQKAHYADSPRYSIIFSYWYGATHLIPSGRVKRQSQNSRAYHKKGGCHTSKLSLLSNQPRRRCSSVPPLPPSLISFATMPLPTSNLFHEASHSADALDESDLHLWEQEPPYNYPEPIMTAHEAHYTKNLVDVLFGWHWRLAKAVRDGRALRFANGKVQDLLDEIVESLVRRVHRWSTIASCITGTELDTNRNNVMADCWLQWQA